MPSILSLPIEIISYVAYDLDIDDLSAFSRSCRAIHTIITPRLYRLVKDEAALTCWAVDEGREGTLARLLAAGANANITWTQNCSRPTTLRFLYTHTPFVRRSSLDRFGEVEPDETDVANDSLEEDEEEEDDDSLYMSDTDSETGIFDLDDRGEPSGRYYWTPLHIAARWGNNDIINLLLRYGADVNARSRGLCDCTLPKEIPRGLLRGIKPITPIWTPLHIAICHGHEATARLLLRRGASTNVSPRPFGSDIRHVTALHTACHSDMVSIARLLLKEEWQTDVDVQDHFDSTPMSYAYFAGSWASIDFLVEMGASLDATLGPFTLLKHACCEGRFAEALRLIELGVDIAASFDPSGGTDSILHYCCMPQLQYFTTSNRREKSQEYFRPKVIRTLIERGADLEARGRESMTPLIKASLFHVDKAVEVLLAEGADINAQDDSGDTALLRACAPRQSTPAGAFESTVTALLAHMPPAFDTSDALKRVCASIMPEEHNAAVLQLLLHHGGSAVLETSTSHELLLTAFTSGNFEICDTLFKNGLREPTLPEIHHLIREAVAQDDSHALAYISKLPHGNEALKSQLCVLDVIKENKSNCAAFLIQSGAPTDSHADSGESCLIEACKLEDTTVAELLLKRGADPNQSIGEGSFPLVRPVFDENVPMIKLLLNHGAMMHARPNGLQIAGRSFSLLDLAIFLGLEDAVETMVEHDSYNKSTEEERTMHLEIACCADPDAFGDGAIVDVLLSCDEIDPNTIFPRTNTTPLHVSMALGRVEAVRYLVDAGADVHRFLAPTEPSASTSVPNPFEGSTPLEWAIDNAPVQIIDELLENVSCDQLNTSRYVRAACRRHKPEVIKLLLERGLDPDTSDDAGNPFLSIFCETIDNIWPCEDTDWLASAIADRSAICIVILLSFEADPLQKNAEGVSALDNIRRMMTYDGPCDFHQEVAKSWNRMLVLDETGVRER
ncbi:ankyrin [Hypoxylon sp. FL0543]|nr:ankyrin [Hypoxylon sp. FL0543]